MEEVIMATLPNKELNRLIKIEIAVENLIENGILDEDVFNEYFEGSVDRGGRRMSRFEISLSKNDLEHIANGYDIKIKINGKRFLETNEIILKPALINDVMAPILNYRNKIIDTEQQNIVNNFLGGAR